MADIDQITNGSVFEDSAVTFLARILGEDGDPITQAEISTITYLIYDAIDPSVTVASGSLDKTVVIFDTLQSDSRWTEDSTGFNFEHTVGPSVFTTPNRKYRIRYLFTLANSNTFYAIFEIRTRKV